MTINSSYNSNRSILTESVNISTNKLDEDIKSQQFEESFIFPLFSEISRVTCIPSIFCVIQILIQLIQALIANFFIGNLHVWKSISSMPKVLRYLSYLINFGVIEILNKGNSENNENIYKNNFSDCWPIYAIIIIFVCIEIIFIIILLFYYRKKRTFLKWTLYITNFLFSTLNSILLAPICGIFGYSFWQIDLIRSASTIWFFIISLISTLVILSFTILNNNFSCNSAYISKSFDTCWDSRTRNLFTVTIGFSSFLVPTLNAFSNWFVFIGFLLILLLNGYQLYLMYYLPYIREMMNSIMNAACILSISAIIMSIVRYFTSINSYVLIFIPVSLFVIFTIFYYFFSKYRINKILEKINTQNEEEGTEDDKKEFLKSICNGNDDLIAFYVHIGITYLSPIFVDYSIMKYIISVKQTPKILFALIQITAMLPAQMQFLTMAIANVTSNFVHFSITQRFILYQARKINVLRQSVSSKEEISEAKRLNKLSEETISLVRGFWGEISHLKSDISTASLRYFRNATIRTSSSYLDAIEQYPRSHDIYNQYIRFLIEAKGDFKESIKFCRTLNTIKEGTKVVKDYAFHAFVNAFPKYVTNQIFDLKGMYVDKNDKVQSNNPNMTLNSSYANSVSSTNRTYHDDEISSTIFDHSKLRLSLQEIINKSKMNSLNILRSLSFVTFLLIFFIIIIIMIVVSNSSKSVHSFVKSISLTSKILTNIQYTGLLIGTRLIENTAYYDRYKDLYPDISHTFCYYSTVICEQLSIDNSSLPDEPSLYNEPLIRINMVAKDIRSYLQEEIGIIFSNPSLHIGEVILYNEWSMNSSHISYYDMPICNYQDQISLVSSLQGIIRMVIRQIEYVSSTNASRFDDLEFIFVLNNLYTFVMINYIVIGNAFESVFVNISQTGINECERYCDIYDILIYIISIAAIIIFFICRLVNFIYVRKEFKNLSILLKGFNKDDIVASSKPIYLKCQERLPTGTVHSAHDFSIEVFLLPVMFLLITVDCIVVVVFMCTETQNYFETFANVFEWSNGAAQRASVLMQLVISLHFDNSELRTDFDVVDYANLTNSIKQITKYQNLIDMEIIGKDSRFDEFYYFNHCDDLSNIYDYADFADCLSVSNKINAAINQLINLNKEYEEEYEILYTYDYAALMYNIDKSIYTEFISFMDYLATFSMKISDENNSYIQTIGIVGIIILFILFIIENTLINMLYNSLEGFKQLIYTLSPIATCRNHSLMLFLSNKKMKDDFMSTSDLILNNSQFSIITINEKYIIQTVNQEFCKLTNYSSQNLLGQSITYLIPLPTDGNGNIMIEKSQFYSAINEMQNKINTNDSCTLKIKMRKEDLSIIHLNSNLIKIKDSSNTFKGVTLLLKSGEENIEMKNKLEQEKKNVNDLMKVMIPRGALNSVKGKKNSAFFEADEATIIFIEITGISDCVSMMAPKGILDILTQIYNGIKNVLEKFNSISMIRWENEMIFGISGLFDNVGNFEKQSFETVAFMIEILQSLEETNIQTNTDFHFRLGAHIGGPVMGFIRDPNIPYFNILSSSFKYLNFMKDNCQTDLPFVTSSLIKHLDLNIFEIKKEITFSFDETEEDVYSIQYKEGYKPLNDNEYNEDSIELKDAEKNEEEEQQQNESANDITNENINENESANDITSENINENES